MSSMIGADSEFSGKMYRDLDDFVNKFTNNYIALKPETAQYIGSKDTRSFPDRLAWYVAEYIRRSDLLRATTKEYEASPSTERQKLVIDIQIQLHKRAAELNAMVQTARARNWFDEGLQAKLDKLVKEKKDLENKIDELTEQLKECQENYARYTEFVKRPKRGDNDDVQLGDVLDSN
ncbi:MAG: hypothetical protein ABSC50_09580 [Candidatus Bathyarchaeia archaeon]